MPIAEPAVAILDDEPEMRKALRQLFTCRGFRVEEYQGGEDLLAALRSHPLDYLLLDLQMPELNGFDVLEAFRSRQISVPVIVITAHDEPGAARPGGARRFRRLEPLASFGWTISSWIGPTASRSRIRTSRPAISTEPGWRHAKT